MDIASNHPSNTRANAYRLAMLAAILILSGASGCRWTSVGQNTLGVRLYQQGRYAEALQQFQTAQRTDPSNPDAYYNLGSTYHKMGIAQKDQQLVEQAESLYNQCLDLQPNHVECHRGLAVLLAESSRPDAALRLLTNWASQNPQASDPRVELARLHREFGKAKVAEQYLDEALVLNPSDHRAWSAKGQMREEAGDLSQAIQNYNQSLAINSLQPEVYQRVASLGARITSQSISGAPPQGGWTVQNPQPNNRY